MNKEKKVIIAKDFNDDCLWDVTILDKTITLYSNNFYLNENKENENAEGYENMVVWNFIEDRTNDEIKYSFINLNKGKNNILSIKGEEVKINENNIGENELFILKDYPEDDNYLKNIYENSSFLSDLSHKIRDLTISDNLENCNINDFNKVLDNLSLSS